MKRYLWGFPPVLWLAGYFAATSGDKAAPSGPMKFQSERRCQAPDRTDIAEALGEFKETWASLHRQAVSESGALPAAKLRERILELKRACDELPEDSDWETVEDLQIRLAGAVHTLGWLQGKEAAAWLESLDPDFQLRFELMAGWAESDPDGAFQAVLTSSRQGPCSSETLMALLQQKAGAGDAVLNQACRDVPWELFRGVTDDPFDDGSFSLAEGSDLQPWIESSAARELADQGVRIGNLFSRWAERNPDQALAGALDWPRSADSEVMQVLGVGIRDPQMLGEISRSLEALPAKQFARVKEVVAKESERNSQFAERLAASYPMILSSDSEPPPP